MARNKKNDSVTPAAVEGGDNVVSASADAGPMNELAPEGQTQTPVFKKPRKIKRVGDQAEPDLTVNSLSEPPVFVISQKEVKFSDLKKAPESVDLAGISAVLMGRPLDESIMFRAGMKGVVWREVKMGSLVTEDYVPNRVNLHLDFSHTIIDVTVG